MSIGERIRKYRRGMKYTLNDLSKVSGLSIGYLSKIERSEKSPPFSTLELLAGIFQVSLYELVEGFMVDKDSNMDLGTAPSTRENIIIVRNTIDWNTGEDMGVHDAESETNGYSLIPLTRNYVNKHVAPCLMSIPPRTSLKFKHDAEEFHYIVKGPIKIDYDNTLYTFETGDSFYIDSRISHSFINELDQYALVLSVIFSYRMF